MNRLRYDKSDIFIYCDLNVHSSDSIFQKFKKKLWSVNFYILDNDIPTRKGYGSQQNIIIDYIICSH